MQKIISALILFFFSFGAFAMTPSETLIAKQTFIWKQALESGDASKPAALYAPQALLYPTFENQKDTQAGILGYFKKLSQHKDLKVVFNKEHTQVYGNVGINSGIYTFSYKKEDKKISVPARYTFVYVQQGDHWLIVNHHSSVLPHLSDSDAVS
jgi:uncharacterized protein (TIGR02246 family)